MRETLATFIIVWMALVIFAPERAGKSAHSILNALQRGWEQTQ